MAVTALVLALGAVLPVVWPTMFPAVDLWNHLAVSQAQRAAWTGVGVLAPFHTLDFTPYPYSGGYLLVALARFLASPLGAGGLVLALAHLMTVAGGWRLATVLNLGRPAWLLAFAACFGMPTWYGFVPYLLGLGPALWVLAELLALQQHGTLRRLAVTSAGLLVVYLLHLEAWATAGFLAGCGALLHEDRARRLGRTLAASLPSLLLAAWWLQMQTDGGSRALHYVYGAPKDRLGMWQLHHLWAQGWLGMVPAVVVAGALVGFLLLVWRRKNQGSWSSAADPTVVGLCLGGAALHLLLPKAVEGGTMAAWGQSLRIGPVLTVLAMTAWPALPLRWFAPGAMVVAVLTLGMDVQAWLVAREFSATVAPLEEHFASSTRPGTRALVLTQPDADRVGQGTLHHLEHVASLWMLHGAVTNQFFRVPGTRLMITNPAALPPSPGELDQQPPCAWAPRLDAVLLQGSLPEMEVRLRAAGFEPTWQHARWMVLERPVDAVLPGPCP